MKNKKPFYSLLVKFEKGQPWSVQFGDYDRETVEDEAEDSYSDTFKTRIICTGPSQVEIDAKVFSLNLIGLQGAFSRALAEIDGRRGAE
jgi:hypothetical protein